MYANIFSISKTDRCKFFSIHFNLFVYLLDLQKSVGVVIHRPILKQLLDQLLEILRYCWCPVKNYYLVLLIFIIDRTGIKNCLPRPTSRKSVVKCLSQGYNRLARVEFKPRLYRSQSQPS